jgi:3-phenylpropionate/trans-cinnamate dioxygenase ferredoxin component
MRERVACAVSEVADGSALRVKVDGTTSPRRDGRGLRRSTTSARTPTCRCPRATSRTAPIECWLHGSRFDLRTGKPTGLPATEPVATIYPVSVEGDDVYVDVMRRRGATDGATKT